MFVLRVFTLAMTALVLVPSGAHLFELPAKIELDRDAYFVVQQIYAGWAYFVIPIVLAIGANLALAMAERHRSTRATGSALAASLLVFASLVIFLLWVYPANQATRDWTVIPENWAALRRTWEYGHAINAGIVFLAFLSSAAAVARR